MANVMVAVVSRPQLGLADLNINDHVNFILSSSSIFSGTVSWRRNQAQSPFVEGQVLVSAVRDLVQDQIAIEVMAGKTGSVSAGHSGLQANLKTLIDAFSQYNYNLSVQWDTIPYTYACQPADYTIDWTGGRAQAQQLQVKFNIFRSPVAVQGV